MNTVQTLQQRSRIDTPITMGLRWAFFTLFFFAFWRSFGWGVALSSALLLLAAGVEGERRMVLVPVSGPWRAGIELLIDLLGIIAVYEWLGLGWGTVIMVVLALSLVMGAKRLSRLVKLMRRS